MSSMKTDDISLNDQPFRDGRIGIIDIGSNSIRLVIYDQHKRSPVAIYNEKVMCAIGKGLAINGCLNPKGVEMAKDALRRFFAMGHNMEITSLFVMATAAIREAKDGTAFAKYIEDMYAVNVDIISGKKEAKLGAYGICASVHKPKGITGDLGGGSLELVWLDDGQISDNTSIRLGSLRLVDETGGDRKKMQELIDKRFTELGWLNDHKTENFYAIGGSFRALAKMHMAANKYPLNILHEYQVPTKELAPFIRSIINTPNNKLDKLPGAGLKRIPALTGGAMILEKIIKVMQPENIIFSASGIREGYLYEKLSHDIRNQDGLISSCTEFATKGGRSTIYADELFSWMLPLIKNESEKECRLRLAFCLLSDIALHIHPEYRAKWAYERIIFSALDCLSHRERIKLALALYHRYQFKLKRPFSEMSLLKNKDIAWAKLVGTNANLAHHITGGVAGSLPKCTIIINGNDVSLQLGGNMQDIIGDAIRKRIAGTDNIYKAYLNGHAL